MPIQPGQLEAVTVSRLLFGVDSAFDDEDKELLTYEVVPAVEIGDLEYQEDGALQANVALTAKIEFSRAEPGPVPFNLEIKLDGCFCWDTKDVPTEPLARGWLEYNGMYLMWPFLRAYVSTITAFSKHPKLMIYTMNVPKPPVIKSETTEDAGEPSPVESDAAVADDA